MAEVSTSTINFEKSSDDASSKQPSDPSQNPASPYYLHPGENPGAILVSPPLNGDNYYHWSRAMKRALSSKNKIKFINGSLPQPAANDPLLDSWERCNNTVVSWITRTLSPHISQSTANFDSAYDLWVDLKIASPRATISGCPIFCKKSTLCTKVSDLFLLSLPI